MRRSRLIRKIIVYAVYILLLTTFQVSFPGIISLSGLRSDLMFVFTVLVSYMFGFKDGMIVGLIIGVIRDYFTAPSVIGLDGNIASSAGIGILVMILAAVTGSSFFTKRIERNFILAFLAVITASLIYKAAGHLIIYLWSSVISGYEYSVVLKDVILRSVMPQTVLNLMFAVPLYPILKFAGPYKKGVNPAILSAGSGEDSLWLTI